MDAQEETNIPRATLPAECLLVAAESALWSGWLVTLCQNPMLNVLKAHPELKGTRWHGSYEK
jgi:hypothetical protein